MCWTPSRRRTQVWPRWWSTTAWVPRSRTCCVGTCRWAMPSPTSAWTDPLGSVPPCRSTQLRRTGPWVDCPLAAPAPCSWRSTHPRCTRRFWTSPDKTNHPRRSGSTVNATFGGSATVSAQVNPLDVLKGQRLPAAACVITAGRDDAEYGPLARRVVAACTAAGMNIHQLPGGHTWAVWAAALKRSVPFFRPAGAV